MSETNTNETPPPSQVAQVPQTKTKENPSSGSDHQVTQIQTNELSSTSTETQVSQPKSKVIPPPSPEKQVPQPKKNEVSSASTETQVPLKKRKMSEHKTTEEKRPSKNLIELNFPEPLQANIGKCHRSLDNSPKNIEDNQEQDDSLEVLERYEKAHHLKVLDGGKIKFAESQSKTSDTQQSQMDPVFYQELLYKNTLEDVALAESRVQQFNHLVSLSEEEVQQVKDHRNNARKIKIFDDIVEELEKADTCQYYHAESESYTVANGVTREMITKSSQKTSAMIDPLMRQCKENLTPKMLKFCNVDLSSTMPAGFTRDDKYPNCITTPMKNLLDKNDRPRLIECGNLHIARKLLNSCKGRKRLYEVYKVFGNSDKDSITKKIIESFFKYIFQDFDEHIDWMMENPEIEILLIVNRESLLTNGILSNKSIVGSIMFSVHGTVGTSINALGIDPEYRYNSFGPFLIHLSQVMGAYEIDVRSDGDITRHFKTYIACRGYLKDFYETLGFSQVESIDHFKKGGKFESFGTHFELDMWIDYTGDDKQIIMETSNLCYKMRNFVDPENYLIEDCLYDNTLFAHKDGLFIPSDSWRASVKKTIKEFQDALEKQPMDKFDFPIDAVTYFTPSKTYIDHLDDLSLPFIGQMFARALNIYEQKRRENRNQVLKSAIPSLQNLKLQIIQRHTVRQDLNDEVWCHLTCVRCQNFCFVKNISLDPIVTFMMKCIFSVWYQHVYTIVPDENSDWNKAFPDWHICEQRNGVDLERLKMATYHDQDISKKKELSKTILWFLQIA